MKILSLYFSMLMILLKSFNSFGKEYFETSDIDDEFSSDLNRDEPVDEYTQNKLECLSVLGSNEMDLLHMEQRNLPLFKRFVYCLVVRNQIFDDHGEFILDDTGHLKKFEDDLYYQEYAKTGMRKCKRLPVNDINESKYDKVYRQSLCFNEHVSNSLLDLHDEN